MLRTSPTASRSPTLTRIEASGAQRTAPDQRISTQAASPAPRGGALEQRPQRLGHAPVAADHLAHVVLGDVQFDDRAFGLTDHFDLHGLGVIDERASDVFDEFLRAHRSAYFVAAGAAGVAAG